MIAPVSRAFWSDKAKWYRASVNTLRCLAGCSVGDMGTLLAFQAFGSPFSQGVTVGIAMAAGLGTSYGFEVGYLMRKEQLPFQKARETAVKMSLVSMLAMEAAETGMELYLTGGVVRHMDPAWWGSLGIACSAGFLAPLPYNYYQLKKHGKKCH